MDRNCSGCRGTHHHGDRHPDGEGSLSGALADLGLDLSLRGGRGGHVPVGRAPGADALAPSLSRVSEA